jgi:hypothetical protein
MKNLKKKNENMEEELKEKIIKEVIACPICKQWLAWCMVVPKPEPDHEERKMAFWESNKKHIMDHENERAAKHRGFDSPDATEVFAIDWQKPKERMPYLCEQCLNPDRKGICTCNNGHTQKQQEE